MKTTWIALRIFMVLTFLTGVIYPLLLTGASQLLFTSQANGSLLKNESGQIVGSKLIGQKFVDPKYFWARPSATDTNPLPSGGSNMSLTSAHLKSKIEERKQAGLPEDLLFASASGLDPHITPQAAFDQVAHIAQARQLSHSEIQRLKELIDQMTEGRTFGILGEPRINVLQLNRKLDTW